MALLGEGYQKPGDILDEKSHTYIHYTHTDTHRERERQRGQRTKGEKYQLNVKNLTANWSSCSQWVDKNLALSPAGSIVVPKPSRIS